VAAESFGIGLFAVFAGEAAMMKGSGEQAEDDDGRG